ncbi:MAG: glutathione S-transferase [Aliidongia sp.]
MASDRPILLHGFRPSGHSHRAELMLNLLGLPYEFRNVDLPQGAQRAPAFLALNPFGTVPVIEDGDDVVADSVAILVYLASRYDADRRWLPTDPVQAALIQRWLSVAQGPVYNGPAIARICKLFNGDFDHGRAVATAGRLFKVLEPELAGRDFLVGGAASLADLALYSYVARAPEGEVSLEPYPAIRAWLGRVEALPRFLPMPIA